MVVLGIGVDIVRLSRMRAFIERRSVDRVSSRILGPREKAALAGIRLHERKIAFLTTRWAAKEAAFKALSGHVELSWKDVEISAESSKSRKPLLSLCKNNDSFDGKLSISHDGDYCIAYVLFQKMYLIYP